LKDLEAARPSAIIDIIHSGEAFEVKEEIKAAQKAQQTCKRCGYMSSNDLCKACSLLEGLERGMASSVITDRARKMDATGPAPDNIRTIPLFRSTPTIAVELPSQS
jgi:cytoplasmic tRNA 2-thiolation protein 1